ncbi:hypothetical protein OCO_43790 [Mycobacterium intracellulare MOTT-02]|nr:hypothetical protein OCO_43790 [Mycobacterium intracellulare MOTT-02]
MGPIFLVVYFVMGLDSLLQWMFYVGLLITAADVLIALALANYGAKTSAKVAALEQSGVLALAQITGITETGTWVNNQQVVKVHLHIAGPGLLPFDSEDRVIASVTRLGNLNARKVVVLVNPTTNEYRIDWERSALVNGLVPAQFTVAEDNRTYDLSGQAGPLMEILQILKANNVPLNRMVDIRSNRRCAARSRRWCAGPSSSSHRPPNRAGCPAVRGRGAVGGRHAARTVDRRAAAGAERSARERRAHRPGIQQPPRCDHRRNLGARPPTCGRIRTRFSSAASLAWSVGGRRGYTWLDHCTGGWHSSPGPPAARGDRTRCGWPPRAPTSSRSTSARRHRPA